MKNKLENLYLKFFDFKESFVEDLREILPYGTTELKDCYIVVQDLEESDDTETIRIDSLEKTDTDLLVSFSEEDYYEGWVPVEDKESIILFSLDEIYAILLNLIEKYE